MWRRGVPKTAEMLWLFKALQSGGNTLLYYRSVDPCRKGRYRKWLAFFAERRVLANQIETVQDVMEDLLGGL